MGNVTGRHALEQLGEDAVGILKALHELHLALPIVALLVLPRAQLAAAEVVDEVHLQPDMHALSVLYVVPTACQDACQFDLSDDTTCHPVPMPPGLVQRVGFLHQFVREQIAPRKACEGCRACALSF